MRNTWNGDAIIKKILSFILSTTLIYLPLTTATQDVCASKPRNQTPALEAILEDISNGRYDYSSHLLSSKQVNAMMAPSYKITHDLEYENTTLSYDKDNAVKEVKATVRRNYFGAGIVLKKSEKERKLLILTAKHVAKNVGRDTERKDKEGRVVFTSKLVKEEVKMIVRDAEDAKDKEEITLKVLLTSPDADISLLEASVAQDKLMDCFPVSPAIGNSSELSPGHVIYLVGFPRDIAKTFTNGIVISLGHPYRAWDDNNVYINATSNNGNSGGPAYAMRDGEPELVGILSWKIINSEGLHGLVRINCAKSLLQDKKIPGYFRDRAEK